MDSTKLTIKEWREAKGISREALADACKVSVQTIKNWENNPKSIRIDFAFQLAKALDVDIRNIFFY